MLRRLHGRVLLREGARGLVLGILLGIVGFGRALLWGSTMPLITTLVDATGQIIDFTNAKSFPGL